MLLHSVNIEKAVVYLPKKKVTSDSMKKKQSQELKHSFTTLCRFHPASSTSDITLTLPTKAAEILLDSV